MALQLKDKSEFLEFMQYLLSALPGQKLPEEVVIEDKLYASLKHDKWITSESQDNILVFQYGASIIKLVSEYEYKVRIGVEKELEKKKEWDIIKPTDTEKKVAIDKDELHGAIGRAIYGRPTYNKFADLVTNFLFDFLKGIK